MKFKFGKKTSGKTPAVQLTEAQRASRRREKPVGIPHGVADPKFLAFIGKGGGDVSGCKALFPRGFAAVQINKGGVQRPKTASGSLPMSNSSC